MLSDPTTPRDLTHPNQTNWNTWTFSTFSISRVCMSTVRKAVMAVTARPQCNRHRPRSTQDYLAWTCCLISQSLTLMKTGFFMRSKASATAMNRMGLHGTHSLFDCSPIALGNGDGILKHDITSVGAVLLAFAAQLLSRGAGNRSNVYPAVLAPQPVKTWRDLAVTFRLTTMPTACIQTDEHFLCP